MAMKTVTRKQVKALVQSTQLVLGGFCDHEEYETWISDDERYDRDIVGGTELIGSEMRRKRARLIWRLRADARTNGKGQTCKQVLAAAIANYVRLARNRPERDLMYGNDRKYSIPAERKGHPAKRHNNCAYCGMGGNGIAVCGSCAEQGIDGPVIKGTAAAKATQYTRLGPIHLYLRWLIKQAGFNANLKSVQYVAADWYEEQDKQVEAGLLRNYSTEAPSEQRKKGRRRR